ncbi:MAG: AAA family ATPase [Christensenellaceae bacterium]|jgi:predicted kinase
MATLHLMIGLPCSGKTTRAKELAEIHHALRLTPDEWHLRLFGDDLGCAMHDTYHNRIEEVMWGLAARVLTLGRDVILDFGCWAKEERDAFRKKAQAIGADFQLHYMNVPYEELFLRLKARNAAAKEDVFTIPQKEMKRYVAIFQPPDAEELCQKEI